MTGKFISFEGGEGCGKTTQAKMLVEALSAKGIKCLHTREPGGEDGAEDIRSLLVTGEANRWEDVTETLLFLAARYQHAKRVIKPALEQGTWVICDRFHDSTRVYQGVGKGVSDKYYQMLHVSVLGNFVPDITILLDIEVKKGLSRSINRSGNDELRFENMDISFHQAVRQGFLNLAKQEPNRISIVDASSDIDAIHQNILDIVFKGDIARYADKRFEETKEWHNHDDAWK